MILYNHDHNSDYVRILINFNMHLWIIRFKYIYAHTTFCCTMIIKFKFLMTFTEVSFTCHKMCPLYEYSSMILKINVYIYAAVTTIQCWCISITPPILSNSFMFWASTPGNRWSAFCLWYHSFIHMSFIYSFPEQVSPSASSLPGHQMDNLCVVQPYFQSIPSSKSKRKL